MKQPTEKPPIAAHDHAASKPAQTTSSDSVDYIKQYIDASAESADRARFVLVVMITASVLAFVAVWNSHQRGWLNSRLTKATHALKFYTEPDEKGRRTLIVGEEALQREVKPRFFSQEEYDSKKTDDEKRAYIQQSEEAFNGTKRFAELQLGANSRFADYDHLRKYVENLERVRTDKVLSVTVPFFGIVFDINDLGMFAGITFAIALLLFRFSLIRELRNVRLVFKQAQTVEHLELCYNMLSMQQVLTIPPQLDLAHLGRNYRSWQWWMEQFWRLVPKFLFLLPLAAHLGILIHDFNTLPGVEQVYPGTLSSLEFSRGILGLNVLLTGLCFYLALKVDRSWKRHADFILDYFLLSPKSLRDPVGLMHRLRADEDPLSSILRKHLASAPRQLLAAYESDKSPDALETLRRTLTVELNRLLRGPCFFNWERPAPSGLSDEARHSIKRDLRGKELVALNRRLLFETYPEQITETPADGVVNAAPQGGIAKSGDEKAGGKTSAELGRPVTVKDGKKR